MLRSTAYPAGGEGTPETQPCSPDPRSRAREHRAFAFLTEEVTSQYVIGALLGHGGGGAVYEGVRKADGMQVAVKFLIRDDFQGLMTIPGDARVLPVEVALMEMISKPHRSQYILQLLEWFEVPRYIILILERPSPCMDLLEYCKCHGGTLPEDLARHIMIQLVKAADHYCKSRVFHNDIKPVNVLINTKTQQIKLIDFGYGDLLKETPYNYCPGTPGYHPPEWYRHKEYMGRPTTVWTLGIVLYQLLHGDVPFLTQEEIMNGHLEFAPVLSKECRKLISQCLNQDPKSRPSFKQILKKKWFTRGQRFTKAVNEASTLSWKTRVRGFGVCLGIGILCSILGVCCLLITKIGLILFIVFYTFGNICSLASTMFLMGPVKQLKRMFDKTRVVATVVMLVCMVLTLCAAFWWKIFALTLLFVILQVLAFTWYGLSYIPFARDAVLKFFSMLFKMCTKCDRN